MSTEMMERGQLSVDLAKLAESSVTMQLGGVDAWMVFSQLQLALRHPANNGPSAETVREVAQMLQEEIAITPTLQLLAERGWLKEYDVEVSVGIGPTDLAVLSRLCRLASKAEEVLYPEWEGLSWELNKATGAALELVQHLAERLGCEGPDVSP